MSAIETPLVRPGAIPDGEPLPRLIAYFSNSSPGNSAIQQLIMLGIPSDRLAVTIPDRLPGQQGMVLSIACPDPALLPRIEELCRKMGAEIHRERT